MSTIDFAERWVDKFARAFRRVEALETIAAEQLGTGAPMLRLVLEAPVLIGHIHVYRAAREALLNSGSAVARAEYEAALKILAVRMRVVSREARAGALIEIRAFHRFIGDVELLALLGAEIKGLPKPILDAVDTGIIRRAGEAYAFDDGPFAKEALGFWTHFQKIVSPSDEVAWKEILDTVRKGPRRLRAGLADINNSSSSATSLAGHVNIVAGKLFEAYASRCPRLAAEFSDMLRLAAVRAARLGEGWKPTRILGEMELVALDSDRLAAVAAQDGLLTSLPWQQFVDSSVVAAKLPAGASTVLGEIELTALFQFKAEAGQTGLTEQIIKDFSRLFQGSLSKTLLARFKVADEAGNIKVYVAKVRPPDLAQGVTAYAVGTSNTFIPDDVLLQQLGVDLRRVTLPRSRDEFNEFAEILIAAALE